MPVYKNIILSILIFLLLNGCSGKLPGADARKVPYDPKERVKKNLEEGRGFRLMEGLGSKKAGDFEFASSNELWRASLDVIDFMPLVSVNYSGGMIITDWYSDDLNSDETIKNHDLQMTFTPASYPEGNQAGLDTEPGFSIAAWQQRPESLGWVNVKSSDPFEKPIIQPNYLSAPEDQRVTVEGIRLSRKLMHTNALSKYLDHELYPGKGVGDSFDELLDIARERGLTCYHQMGTCRMGPSADKTAVVSNELKVHGIENLRVVDASIMPTMLSANLNAGAMMIGEKASGIILKEK